MTEGAKKASHKKKSHKKKEPQSESGDEKWSHKKKSHKKKKPQSESGDEAERPVHKRVKMSAEDAKVLQDAFSQDDKCTVERAKLLAKESEALEPKQITTW